MCGIAGLFSKSSETEEKLGAHLSGMLAQLADRGPDSAGVAIYRDPAPSGSVKVSLFCRGARITRGACSRVRWPRASASVSEPQRIATHALFTVEAEGPQLQRWLAAEHPELRVMSIGEHIEIYKEKGDPRKFIKDFGLETVSASHALGHTRMATESRVTTEHSHPFSTGSRPLPGPQRVALEPQPAARRAAAKGDRVPDRQRLRGRRRLPDLAALGGRRPGDGAERLPGRPGRLLHLRRRHGRRVCGPARPDRLQAGGDGRERRMGGDGLGVPGDRDAARRRGRRALGARARTGLLLAAGEGRVSRRPGHRGGRRPHHRLGPGSEPAPARGRGRDKVAGREPRRSALDRRGPRRPRSRSRSTATPATTAPA